MRSFVRIYLMPGFVFQAVVIGGGYGTGRELVEFFLSQGPRHGLAAMAVSTLIWSCVLALSFELARVTRSYDYRSFIRSILGRGWIAYEVLFIAFIGLVVSVVSAASGQMLHDMVGSSIGLGTIGATLLIAALLLKDSDSFAKLVSIWSAILYIFFLVLVSITLVRFSNNVGGALRSQESEAGWIVNGVRYACYNIGIVPAILFCVTGLRTRAQTTVSGLLAGLIGMAPALLIYVTLLSRYPAVLSAPIPINVIIASLGIPVFGFLFQAVLLGTFIDTAVGLIHGVNERIAGTLSETGRSMPRLARPLIGLAILIVSSTIASQTGVIALIANGYGTLTWGFLLVFVLPVLTAGVLRIWRGRPSPHSSFQSSPENG